MSRRTSPPDANPPARKRPGRPAGAKTAERSRAPGRPVSEAGPQADQRERLLDAALACFCRHGIAASSLRHIAQEAGVTPAMVHYYFGDKPALQQAVVAERLMPVMAELRAPMMQAGAGDIAALVAGWVHGVSAIVARYPWLPTLWVREVLMEGGALRGVLLEQVGPAFPRVMVARFAQAQADG